MSLPFITHVTSTPVTGTYGPTAIGSAVSILVNFNEPLIVTAMAGLPLNVGTSRTATYAQNATVEAAGIITFTYTVTAGDAVGYGGLIDYTCTSLTGTVTSLGSGVANLTLPPAGGLTSLSGGSQLYVDTHVPTLLRLTSCLPNGNHADGAVIPITLTTSEPVLVTLSTGRPMILLNSGPSADHYSYAVYETGSGTDELLFTYTVLDGDGANPLNNTSGDLLLTGCQIADYFGNAVTATLPSASGSNSLSGSSLFVIGTGSPVDPTGAASYLELSSITTGVMPLTRALTDVVPGVGDGDDLAVKMKLSVDGRWYPVMHTGWYYTGETERYLYGNKSQTTAVSSGGVDVLHIPALITSTTTKPIVVKRSLTGSPFTQVALSPAMLQLGAANEWSLVAGTTDKWRYGGELVPVELYRTSVDEPMRRVSVGEHITEVANYDAIIDQLDYTFEVADINSNPYYTVTVASSASPTVYALAISSLSTINQLTSGTNALLMQTEVVVVDSKNRIRTMFNDVDTVVLPTISWFTGGIMTTITVASSSVTGNLLQLPTASVRPRDRVVVSYYVTDSYIVDPLTGDMYIYSPAEGAISVCAEAAVDPWWDSSLSGASTVPTYTQLNPVYSGVKSGFLYLCDDEGTEHHDVEVALHISPTVVTVAPWLGCGPPVRILARLTDSDGNPVDNTNVGLWVSGAGYVAGSYGATTQGRTDGRGELVYSWAPTGIGTTTITASISGKTKTLELRQLDMGVYDAVSRDCAARKLFISIDSNSQVSGLSKITAYATTCDGLYPIRGVTLYFESEKSKFTNNRRGLTTGEDGIAETDYYPVEGDTIVAWASVWSQQSGNVTLFSNTITIGGPE